MKKMICTVIAIAFGMPTLACAAGDIVTPSDQFEGMYGAAYGHVLSGTPNLTIKGDTLYVGKYAYTPKRCPQKADSSTSDAAILMTPEQMGILLAAHKAAEGKTDREWVDAFICSVNDQGKAQGTTASAQEQGRVVIVTIPGLEDIVVRPAWSMYNPVAAGQSTDDGLEAARKEFLTEYYNKKVWVFFGWGYDILVPAQRHAETLTAMRKTLDRVPLSDAERENTPLKYPAFVRDFLAAVRGGK